MKSSLWQLIICAILYTVISWVLLFRQEETLIVVGQFYPAWAESLPLIRSWLLHHGLNSIVTIFLFLIFGVIFFSYLKLLRQKLSTKKVIILAIFLQVIVFFSYPVLSTDIFDYILTNRLALVHGQNIWQIAPSSYPNDLFYHLANWQNQTSPYGVVNQAFYALAGQFATNDLLQSVFVYKLLILIFSLATLILLKKILERIVPDKVSWGILLVFANPLFVIETAGSAHNIIITIFFMLLSFSFFVKKNFFFAGIVSALAIHTKFAPIFLTVFMFIYMLKERNFKSIVTFSIPFVVLNLVFFGIIGSGTISYLINILVGKPIYWQSLPQLVHKIYPQENLLFLGIFVLIFLGQMIRVLFRKLDPITGFVETMAAYLLFFTNFYLNWYVLWILIFVPIIAWGRLSKTIILFSATSLLSYPLYMSSLRFSHENPIWTIIIYIFISAVPAVYYLISYD